MKQVKHWQDAVNAVLGAWLVAAPWVLGFQGMLVAAAVTTAIGALLIASSVEAMQVPQAWEEWLDVMLGIGLMLSPLLFGFDGVAPALQNALITGGLVTVLALWVLVTVDEFAASWEEPIR